MQILRPATVQVKPAAAVIIFDSAASRTPRPFGLGLIRTAPAHRVDYTAADAAWGAATFAAAAEARERAELDAEVEAMAEDRHQFAAYMGDESAYAFAEGEPCEAGR